MAMSTLLQSEPFLASFFLSTHCGCFPMLRGLMALAPEGDTSKDEDTGRFVKGPAAVPEGLTFAELYEGLKARGYIIYGCKDVLAERFFQVANMGDLEEDEIRLFLIAVEEVIESTVSKPRPRSDVGWQT